MERLTTKETHPHGAEGVSKDTLTGRWCRGEYEATAVTEKLAEYENLEEDGMLIKLPCEEVYFNNRITRCRDIRELTIFDIAGIDRDGLYWSSEEKAKEALSKE